ncbi:CDP-glucose 4,6-dehydratase [Arenicellales bacterium nBUS_45]
MTLKTNSINLKFWKDKRVLLTGHTGFKGSWLSLWLQSLGSDVHGFALPPSSNPSLFNIASVDSGMRSVFGDIRDLDAIRETMDSLQPDIVIHMAAQAIVRTSYDFPIETFSTNVMGTTNLLEAARLNDSVKAIVNVTTDKCYQNKEWLWGYRENDSLGGYDPYSSSKACSELVTDAYRRSFFRSKDLNLASARAGNVIGGGDWAADRLIPDTLTAFEKNEPVVIRNPESFRPWQHVLEPLSGYMMLAERLFEQGEEFAEGWNFGPSDDDVRSVVWIVERMAEFWGGGVGWKVDNSNHPHESKCLKLDITKAKIELGWHPTWRLDKSLEKIVDWHQSWLRRDNMRDKCLEQISEFVSDWSNATAN